MAKRNIQFQTIRTEGAILPPDILRRIASLKVDGATPDSYHLPPGSKLNEVISRSWTSLLNYWQAFQEARANLPESDETGTAVTNERWLLPLFKELDFGRLVTTKSPEIEDRVYPIERLYNHTPIHLIGCKLPLDRRTKGARGAATASPHSMVQEFLNRSEEHLWAFLSNGLQLRILRDNISLSRQAFVEFDLEAMMEGEVYADFALLWMLCHQSRVEADKISDCWLEKWTNLAREQGTRVLNDLRVGVANAIEALGKGFIGHPHNDHLRDKLRTGTLSKDDFYRQLLRTVYRLLFLFVAEDRELLHPPLPETEEESETNEQRLALQQARDLYDTHYSTRRLRELAHKIRGSKHSDLWHSLSLVFDTLGRNEGCSELGLCGLGSFLWQSSSTADLRGPQHRVNGNGEPNSEPAFITNDDLLQAIRALAYVEQGKVLRIVDYRNLGSEELGSVYESLLELHPAINIEAKEFELSTAAGNERKTTGSYYTPDSLVQCLLDSALDPVVEERLKGKKGEEAEAAILDMKVCDPACGSGHFLIAAAHRLARHLARIRTGETEPSPDDYQHALRDIIGHCIYGVDINPMAVELCKVSLWVEAIEPGRPLSFLDHHIQCGNSLLGTTPALLSCGLPDDAFKPIEGDDKQYCATWKKKNKEQRKGQTFFDFDDDEDCPWKRMGDITSTFRLLDQTADETIEGIHEKEECYRQLIKSSSYLFTRFWADAWCAAFVWKKCPPEQGGFDYPITNEILKRIRKNPHDCPPWMRNEVIHLAKQYQFFHWHIEFPDVFKAKPDERVNLDETTGWDSGFDCVLGNPPWERIKLQEREFFGQRSPKIAAARTAAARLKLVNALQKTNPTLFSDYKSTKRFSDGIGAILRNSGRFPLGSRGDTNTYPVFVELSKALLNSTGQLGCVVPSGLATDDTYKLFFQDLMTSRTLRSLISLFEIRRFFPGTDSRDPFCLLTISKATQAIGSTRFAFDVRSLEELNDSDRLFGLSADDIALLNPNTRTCPVFANRHNAEITKFIFRRHPVILQETPRLVNPWNVKFATIFHSGNDSKHFQEVTSLLSAGGELCGNKVYINEQIHLPLYEQNMIHVNDHRFATYQALDGTLGNVRRRVTFEEHARAEFQAMAQFWVTNETVNSTWKSKELEGTWSIAFRKSARIGDVRTGIFCALPRCAASDSIHLITDTLNGASSHQLLLSQLSSFAFDFIMRQCLGGANASFYIIKQLPAIHPDVFREKSSFLQDGSLARWVTQRIVELTYTAWDTDVFAHACGYVGPPFRWHNKRREIIRNELDAAFFHLYLGTEVEWCNSANSELLQSFSHPREAVSHIMDSFQTVRDNDLATFDGVYRTKQQILEIYDEMAEAIRTGQPYQTRLDPPPGPPTDAEGNFIPMAEWDKTNWPSHIHSPRETAVEETPTTVTPVVIDPAFPSTDIERVLCACLLDFVQLQPGLTEDEYADAIVLMMQTDNCSKLLTGNDRSEFEQAIQSVSPDLIADSSGKPPWRSMIASLLANASLDRTHTQLTTGSSFNAVRNQLSDVPGSFTSLVAKAAERLRELQSMVIPDDSEAGQVAREIFEQHQTVVGS